MTRNEEYAGGFPPGMEAFEKLTDPRNGKAKRHYFGEILFIALAAMICGMEGFGDFERIFKLPHGTPSDDTFRRIFTALTPKAFVECFTAHVRFIRPDLADELIAIDGKTLRHSFDHGDPESSLHLISAWSDGCGQSLGQLPVDGKTNEITAAPKLLRQIDVKGTTVTLDAMGCQKKIAQETHFAGAHYCLNSHAPDADLLGRLARRHWGIENRCHWVLDMTFDDDHCRANSLSTSSGIIRPPKTPCAANASAPRSARKHSKLF